jgi:hypothetical protein
VTFRVDNIRKDRHLSADASSQALMTWAGALDLESIARNLPTVRRGRSYLRAPMIAGYTHNMTKRTHASFALGRTEI